MSYPTNDNSKWEPPEVETLVLPPRRRSIIREEQPDGNVEEKDAPLERWTQVLLYCCVVLHIISSYLLLYVTTE